MAQSSAQGKLSFDVDPHPDLAGQEHHWLHGTLHLKLEATVHADLQSGDRLIVHVVGPDGERVAACEAEVTHPSFPPIVDPKVGVIGIERRHHAKRL